MKILIADDHELYREALSLLVSNQFADADITEVADFRELLGVASEACDWAAFIIDLNMPGADFPSAIRTLNQRYPTVPIVVITSSDRPEDTQQALQAGALGYILKSMKNEEIAQSLTLIVKSGISLHPATSAPPSSANGELTPRQTEVLKRMCEGASNKRIALDMGLSESTVKIHVRAILSHFDVANRTEAVIQAKKYLQLPDS